MSKIVLVTGATDGIGKMTALRLAQHGYHVIVHGRDGVRVATAVAEIKQKIGASAKLDSSVFDLSSLDAVVAGAQDLRQRFPKLDILLNNAGTYQKEKQLSKDGLELTMATNHFGPTLLTLLLRPSLEKSREAKVIFVSSVAHNRGVLNPENYNFESSFSAYEAYATSKLANLITAQELAKEWEPLSIPVYALHPGVITTKLLKAGFNIDGGTLETGSDTSVFLVTTDLPKSKSGKYFDNSEEATPSPLSQNKQKTTHFWQWTQSKLAPKTPKGARP
ncbi:MAG: SDR family NAD(P)-dependent oxidoreductase [Bdellovibrionaceae bacterium]|nr:SDR family NAD(P)-dependent oxidoreductase [Pseudobdellovibrionaceae bacterium]